MKQIQKNLKSTLKIGLIISMISVLLVYSFLVGKYRLFPYEIIETVKWNFSDKIIKTGLEITQFDLFAPKVDVVFLGDSITAEANWHDMFPNLSIANRGAGGETVAEISLRLDEILILEPKRIFIMAGINDIYRNDSIDNIKTYFENVIIELTRKNPSIKIFLQSTLECQKNICGESKLNSVRELNIELMNIAQNYPNIKYININEYLSNENGLLDDYSKDGIHINAYGYKAWRDGINIFVNGQE